MTSSLDQDPLVCAYKIFASPAPASTSTFPPTPTRPPLRHFAATSESGGTEDDGDGNNKGNGLLTAEPYRTGRRYSPSSRSGSSSDRSGSSSPSSSEGCITPEDELTEYAVHAYARARSPSTDNEEEDDDDDDAELEWGRNEELEVEVEEVADVDLPVVRLEAIKRCGGNSAADVEEHDSFALPAAPKSSPRMPSHGGKWPGGCERHHDGAVPGGMLGVTPEMATSHVLHYAVQMLHVFPPEPARRWM